MKIDLKLIDFEIIRPFFEDFQHKSKCFELPHPSAQCIGIYNEKELMGFFIVLCYNDKSVDITHGYLTPLYRNKFLQYRCLHELEQLIKKIEYKVIRLCTNNRFKAYLKFMDIAGYKPTRLIFQKEVS